MGIMANEVIRRLLNMGGDIEMEVTWEVMDNYAVKFLTSEYPIGHNLERHNPEEPQPGRDLTRKALNPEET